MFDLSVERGAFLVQKNYPLTKCQKVKLAGLIRPNTRLTRVLTIT